MPTPRLRIVMADTQENIDVSVVLNVLGLRELAAYGFRSWMLQDYQRPYEVVLNLFVPCRELFEPLMEGKNPNCRVSIYQYEEPEFFNISAANNLGLATAKGKYVSFANADMIYPGAFLTRAMGEILRRDLCYAIAARVNMTPGQTEDFHKKQPLDFKTKDDFNGLLGLERSPDVYVMAAISPWTMRRDVAMAVGGFDPLILFAEDRDLDYRILHYMRRMNLQHAQVSFCNLFGYHQWHKGTGLYNTWDKAKAIMEPRGRRLEADFNSTEDVLPTRLTDIAALKEDMAKTEKPPLANQYRKDWRGKIQRRAKRVWKALTDI
jgi:hypothetical protein